jgi:DNA polymerase-3 subunit epsilon
LDTVSQSEDEELTPTATRPVKAKSNAWLIFLATATLEVGAVFLAGWIIWINLTGEERASVAGLWIGHAGMPILAGVFLLLLLGLGINLMFRWYIIPLRALAEETRVMAMSNAGHRVTGEGRPELQDLMAGINLLAERHQSMQREVEIRIQEANAALEEEKSTLAALMSKLTQGVLVCNRDGRILLYNQRAQALLEETGANQAAQEWIGLGRSVYAVLDENLVSHALSHIEHHVRQGETALMAPFIASRGGGRLLSVHLVPILDGHNAFTGYILTLQDITHRAETESRRSLLLQSLTEGQRSGIAGIRAAIEAVLDYPDMDKDSRLRFLSVIRDEALKLSGHLDQLEAEYSLDLKAQWPLEEMLGSDLLATIERGLQDKLDAPVKLSVPREPLWVKVDSYAIVQALRFVVGRLKQQRYPENLALDVESQTTFAHLTMSWQGPALAMEQLRSWARESIMAEGDDPELTLHDVIERHGGTLWTQTEPVSEHCALHLLLPTQESEGVAAEPLPEDPQAHFYDFRLFKRATQKSNLQQLPLEELAYTVIDTETTGLHPSDGDEIIAIGAVRIVNERILRRESFDCLIKPRKPVSDASVAIHGITPDMLRRMPRIEEVLPRFRRFVEDTVIVGHNVFFDMQFLEKAEERTGISFVNPVLDTLLLSHVIHPNQKRHSMEAIAGRLGIPVSQRHSALGDALTTAEIFLALLPLLRERGILTLRQAQESYQDNELARVVY